MAEFCQPRIALKIPQPPCPPLSSGLQHWEWSVSLWSRGNVSSGTYVDVPDALADVIRSWAIAQLGSVAANDVVPLLLLKVPHRAREQAGTDKVQKAGREDQEPLELGGGTTPVVAS